MRTRIKNEKVYVLSFILPLFAWIIMMILFKVEPFGKNTFLISDALHQYYPFFSQYREKLLGFESLQYSFGGGLGFDFISLWSYYLSSPLNLVITLFPREQLSLVMTLLMVLKGSLCGVSFAYYLRHRGYGKDVRVVPFACGYALSSFMVGYFFDIMWQECLILFPIILAGLEKLLKEGKWKLYTASLFLALWCNFYITFIICIFLILWFLCYEFQNPRDFFRKGMAFAGTSILAAAMAGVVLVPAFIATSATQGGVAIPGFTWMTNYTEIFAGEAGGIFAFNRPVSVTKVDYQANIYCGTFVLGFFLLYFMNSRIKISRKIKLGILIVFLVISFNEQCLNYIWHGFHYQVGLPNRFSFLLIFLLLLSGYTTLRDIGEFAWWKMVLSGLAAVGGLTYLSMEQSDNVTVNMLISTITLLAGYLALSFCMGKGWLDCRSGSALFILIAVSELTASLYFSEKSLGQVSVSNFYREIDDLHEAKAWIDEQNGETQFYREELSNPTVSNEGMAYDLNTTGIFSSMLKQDVAVAMRKIGYRTSSNQIEYGTGTPVINTLFGIKYILIIGEDAIRVEDRYEKARQIGNVAVYENQDVLPVGYMVNEETEDLMDLDGDNFENQMELLRLMTGKEYEIFTPLSYELTESHQVEVEQVSDTVYYYLGAEESREDNLVFEATVSSDSDIYMWISARHVDKVKVRINDTLVADKKMEEGYYHVGEVKEGDVITVSNAIDLSGPTYSSMSLMFYEYQREEMDLAYQQLQKGAMKMTAFAQNHLEGSVNAEEDGLFFTTIPYDDAWTAVVDGEEVETEKGAGAFLSISLEKGEHTIELHYRTPGLKEGILLSVSAAFLMVCMILWDRKRRYNHAEKQEKV